MIHALQFAPWTLESRQREFKENYFTCRTCLYLALWKTVIKKDRIAPRFLTKKILCKKTMIFEIMEEYASSVEFFVWEFQFYRLFVPDCGELKKCLAHARFDKFTPFDTFSRHVPAALLIFCLFLRPCCCSFRPAESWLSELSNKLEL